MTGLPAAWRERATVAEDRKAMRDDAAIEQVIGAYGPAIWRLAGTFEFDRARRQDLMQDMLVAIWQALPKLEDRGALKAFVFRIARNRGVSHVARQVRQPRTRPEGEGPGEERSGSDPGPCQDLERQERRRRLRQAVRGLPLGQREAITLFLEGLSHAEIAAVLAITENNVAVRINRARARLTESLAP